ncbi:hypothetical protein [Alloprevotella tannerae]|nr:hypothetical protein [Alloprevotella tannerae]
MNADLLGFIGIIAYFCHAKRFKEAFRSDKAVKSHLLLSQKNLLTP